MSEVPLAQRNPCQRLALFALRIIAPIDPDIVEVGMKEIRFQPVFSREILQGDMQIHRIDPVEIITGEDTYPARVIDLPFVHSPDLGQCLRATFQEVMDPWQAADFRQIAEICPGGERAASTAESCQISAQGVFVGRDTQSQHLRYRQESEDVQMFQDLKMSLRQIPLAFCLHF